MNCELFSIRGNQEEINRLNQNLGAIVAGLAKLDIQILFKTEIDRSTSKIEEAIINSVNDQSSPEIIIIALVVLLLFGGKKIPELMRGIGKGVRSFKEGINGIEKDIKDNTDVEANAKSDVEKN